MIHEEPTVQTDSATLMSESVERETKRLTYPEGFPPLPPLPAARYFDQQFYDLEIEHVFYKTWISAAHISELPIPGSYRLFEKLNLSIIISRGLDGEIRAFRNVCRHRGAAILKEEKGTARRFVCPYHAWAYSLDGKLVSVPEESYNFACFDKAQHPLHQVRCELWHGFIFINLDKDAEPLADFLAQTSAEVADFPLEEMIVKDILTVDVDCNWKTAYDNFLEIYHVNVIHAKSLAPYFDSKSFTISLLKNGHARFVTRRKFGKSLFSDGKQELEPEDFTARFKEHTVAFPIFPNIFTALDPIGFAWQTFWPAGPSKSIMQVTLMGWKRDDAADREFWAQMKVNQINVLNEDIFLFPSIQRSMKAGELTAIPLSYQERQIYWYHEEIDRRIGTSRIPEHLRVKPVLAPFASR
jgi:phenylpropionate dioxygenase-like ring-hydroxylating dioxygenase large terminal subunit